MIVRVFVYSRMWECGKCWYRATEKPNRQPKFGVKNRLKPTGNAKSRTVTTLYCISTNNMMAEVLYFLPNLLRCCCRSFHRNRIGHCKQWHSNHRQRILIF